MKKLYLFLLLFLLVVLVGCSGGGMAVMPKQQATWTGILALLVPLIAVGIMQLGWSKKANSLIALAVTVAFAFLDAWYFGTLTPDNLVQAVFEILTGALVTYKTIWGPLGVIDWWAQKTTFQRFKVPHRMAAPGSIGLPW